MLNYTILGWALKREHENERPFNTTRFYKHVVKNPGVDSTQVISEIRLQNSPLCFFLYRSSVNWKLLLCTQPYANRAKCCFYKFNVLAVLNVISISENFTGITSIGIILFTSIIKNYLHRGQVHFQSSCFCLLLILHKSFWRLWKYHLKIITDWRYQLTKEYLTKLNFFLEPHKLALQCRNIRNWKLCFCEDWQP